MRRLEVISVISLFLLPACAAGVNFSERQSKKSDGEAEAQAETPPADADATGDDETADIPVWVNGSYLTCAWSSVTSDTEAELGCGLHSTSAQSLSTPDQVLVSWSVAAKDGAIIASKEQSASEADALTMTFIVAGSQVSGAIVSVTLAHATVSGGTSGVLDQLLPGFDHASGLAQCLASATPVLTCLGAAGVVVPLGTGYQGVTDPSAPQTPSSPQTPSTGTDSSSSMQPRAVVGGHVYYFGNAGESCVETCAAHGGTTDATISVIGSAGSGKGCVDALTPFGHISVLAGETGGAGVGCSVESDGTAQQVVSPVTTHDAKSAGVSRVCSCAL